MIKSPLKTTNTFYTVIKSATFFATLLMANVSYGADAKVSVSFGQLEKNATELSRSNFLIKSQNKSQITNDATMGVERSQYIKNYVQPIKVDKNLAKTNSSLSSVTSNLTASNPSSNYEYQFSIFTAKSSLLTDEDLDGYYQSFSIDFDADYLRYDDYDSATVYAEMYLSKDGGPWLHYYTTDAFNIHSDDNDDNYEVVTTLVDGYSSHNYDVLIDLYEVGYVDVVATYSSDDSNALYALPLESSNYDIYQPDVVVVESYSEGGSFAWLLLLPISLLAYRRKQC